MDHPWLWHRGRQTPTYLAESGPFEEDKREREARLASWRAEREEGA